VLGGKIKMDTLFPKEIIEADKPIEKRTVFIPIALNQTGGGEGYFRTWQPEDEHAIAKKTLDKLSHVWTHRRIIVVEVK
jgi:hypothetical protein